MAPDNAHRAKRRTFTSAAENEFYRTRFGESRTARPWSLRSCATAEKLWCMPEPIRVIPPHAFVDSDPTAGMRRKLAIDVPGLWSGLVHTEPGAISGWHHHGDHETSLYVVSGAMRLEFGAGGRSVVEARPGHFVHVPARVVHRESNPTDLPSSAVIARAGTGEPTVNVDGPDGA